MFLDCLVSNMRVANIGLAITVKHRSGPGEIEAMNIVGDVDGKHCIIVDDMIDTAGTLCTAASELLKMGARSVSACATHGLFNGPAFDRIEKSVLQNVVVADTIPLRAGAPSKIRVVSCAELIAEAIYCINHGQSVSGLFKVQAVATSPGKDVIKTG